MKLAIIAAALALTVFLPAQISAVSGQEFTRTGPPLIQDLLPASPGQSIWYHGDGGGP